MTVILIFTRGILDTLMCHLTVSRASCAHVVTNTDKMTSDTMRSNIPMSSVFVVVWGKMPRSKHCQGSLNYLWWRIRVSESNWSEPNTGLIQFNIEELTMLACYWRQQGTSCKRSMGCSFLDSFKELGRLLFILLSVWTKEKIVYPWQSLTRPVIMRGTSLCHL